MDDAPLILSAVYQHEQRSPRRHHMTQPVGKGALETYTWARTVNEARRMASYLRALRLPPSSPIALISKNCAEFIIADLAIWMSGHISVAIFPTLSAEGYRYILQHSEARLVFLGKLDDPALVQQALPEGLPRVVLSLAAPGVVGPRWHEVLAEHAPLEDSPERDAADLALLVYTSGSTGRPKAAMHTFGGIAAAGRGLVQVMGLGPSDRMLSYLPLAHVMERLGSETTSLMSGMQLYFPESIETFVSDLRRARPTIFASVPRLWLKLQAGVWEKLPAARLERLLRVPILSRFIRRRILHGLGLDQVRVAISGSAPIPAEVIHWYRELGLELLEGYGMTENFAYSHVSRRGQSRVGYVGHAQPGVQCKLSPGGEVLVKSPANMLGYFKEPELSAQAFTEDGYLQTGDLGELDEGGCLRISGRVKELFKTSKGKYVAPAPIENLLNTHPGVEASCVLGSGQRAPCAVLNVSNGGADAAKDLEALLTSVNQRLEAHERLQFLVVAHRPWSIAEGQLTPTLKIRRESIERDMAPKLDAWYRSGASVIREDSRGPRSGS